MNDTSPTRATLHMTTTDGHKVEIGFDLARLREQHQFRVDATGSRCSCGMGYFNRQRPEDDRLGHVLAQALNHVRYKVSHTSTAEQYPFQPGVGDYRPLADFPSYFTERELGRLGAANERMVYDWTIDAAIERHGLDRL